MLAGAALGLIVIMGLVRGDDFDTLFIDRHHARDRRHPDRPAGGRHDAAVGRHAADGTKGAIIKRLKSVETLGSTSAICSDKTGHVDAQPDDRRASSCVVGRRFNVEGEGYSPEGKILRVFGTGDASLEPFCMPMALANDAVIRDGACIGDPTEGALVVLAAKGGLDVDETRRTLPARR